MAKKVSAKFSVDFCSPGGVIFTKFITNDEEDFEDVYDYEPWDYAEEIEDNGGQPENCFPRQHITVKLHKNCMKPSDFYNGYDKFDFEWTSPNGVQEYEVADDNPFFEYDPEYKTLIYKEKNQIVAVADIGFGKFKLPEGNYTMSAKLNFSNTKYHSPVRFPKYVTSLPDYCFQGSKVEYIYIDGALKGTRSIFTGIKRVKMIVAGNTDPDIFRASYGVRIAAVKGYGKAVADGNYDPKLTHKWNEFIIETLLKTMDRSDCFRLHPNVQKYIKSQKDFGASFITRLTVNGMLDR